MLHIRQNKYTGVMEIAEEGRMVGSEEIDRLIDDGKAIIVDMPAQSNRIKFHMWDRRPNEVYVDPLIFKMMLPESYTINNYGMLINSMLASLSPSARISVLLAAKELKQTRKDEVTNDFMNDDFLCTFKDKDIIGGKDGN